MLEYISTFFVLTGACLVAIGLFYTAKIIKQLPGSSGSWRAMFCLIVFLFLGYISFATEIAGEPASLVTLVASLMFFGAGCFVLVVTNLSAKTIFDIKQLGVLEAENTQIRSIQQRLETILNNTAEGIITFDANGVIDTFNQAAEKLFGYQEEEVAGESIGQIVAPPDPSNGHERYLEAFLHTELERLLGHESELVGRHKDGHTFPMAVKFSALVLDGRQLYIGLVSDISERKAMIEHLREMAEHDGLTRLYNRTYFQQELERVVERAKRDGQRCSLIYIDLDNFKYVNDTLGHVAGDRLLMEVSKVLVKRTRKSDLLARLGGDEFTILLYDMDPKLGTHVAESFRKKLSEHVFRYGGKQIDIGCSIGVAAVSSNSDSAEEVLSQADLACHLAKRRGRNCVHAFEPDDQADVASMSADMGWSRRIKQALEKDQFVLAYQPIVCTQDRQVESYEVLVRMRDERDGLIMPNGFLPSAERFGLASEIDKWVIANAIDALVEQRKRIATLRYSINLAAQTLSDSSVCDLILKKLDSTGLDPTALTFEVTETAAISDMTVAGRFLSRLQQMGCKTALDDFGSGMSSFAYLRDLPVDIVKIDGRFVQNLAQSSVDQAMVRAMNDIAHSLGKQTVAEFVEDEQSFRLLAEYRVDYAQGYYLGRPLIQLPPMNAAGVCKALG